ncbi:hypothetical protein BST85_02925 [Aureitalea marina]|uniref:Glycosyltransferase RgtA/B/C/D-like domain-containing protein n=2 Tax=Aureitalea marina TaxID=930804 RepID=A0A2S7KN34_9FLAO|nr:hypothetical protein BST85_02925 [Aureitalea marina]
MGWKIISRSEVVADFFLRIRKWIIAVKSRILRIDRLYLYSALVIVGISFLFNLYNVLVRPIFYDEAWTYLNFTRPGFLTAISYYPLPNNHVLHSVLTVMTRDLPFGTTVNLRLSNLLVSLITALVFAYTSYRLFSKRAALVLLPLFCFLFPVSYYSYLSRGYMLLILAFVICHYAVMRLTAATGSERERRKYSLLLVAGGILGLYTMPSFVYPFFCCVGFVAVWLIFKSGVRSTVHFLGLNLLGGLIVAWLYGPILFRSGLNSLINNEMVQPISRAEVWSRLGSHFSETSEFLFGMPLIVFTVAVVVMLMALARKVTQLAFWIFCLVMPPIILMIHGVIPFSRTWIYLVVIVLSILGQLIRTFEDRIRLNHTSIVVFGSLFIALSVFQFTRKIQLQEFYSYRAMEVAEYLMDEEAKTVYVNHPLTEINLRYIFLERDSSIQIIYSRNLLDEEEVEQATECCDWILLEEAMDGEIEWRFHTAGEYPMVLGRTDPAE